MSLELLNEKERAFWDAAIARAKEVASTGMASCEANARERFAFAALKPEPLVWESGNSCELTRSDGLKLLLHRLGTQPTYLVEYALALNRYEREKVGR